MTISTENMRPIGKQIAVVDNGFIYVGEVMLDGVFCLIADAKNIRVWGTTKGLGQLSTGPTSETKTDFCGNVLIPISRVCHFIEISKGW